MNRTKVYIAMYNEFGCLLGSLEPEEVIRILQDGTFEPGDKFVVCELGDDE